MQLPSLLWSVGLGIIFVVIARRVITIVTEPQWAVMGVNHEYFRRRVFTPAPGKSVQETSRQIEWPVERFVGLDCRDLRGGRLSCHRMLHPPLKP